MNHQKKSILFVMNTLGRAGAEHALIELINHIDPQKYTIFLYVLIPRGEVIRRVPDHVTLLNSCFDSRSVLSLDGKVFILRHLLKRAFSNGSFLKAVYRYICTSGQVKRKGRFYEHILRRLLADWTPPLKEKFDLAVAYLEGPATWYVAEKIQAVKKAAFIHIDYGKAGYTRALDQDCYEEFDRIFAVSREVKRKFLSVYPEYTEKVCLFFNIVNKQSILKKAEMKGGFKDQFDGIRLLTVGRLSHQKGHDIAVLTALQLKERGYHFRWYVVGEGHEKKRIKNLIRKLKLQDEFVLLGASENPYPFFQQTDIYVCTSRFEGKSLVIEEAQILGKPVVSLECTGINEQICSGKDGIVVKSDYVALAEKIGELMDNPEKRNKLGREAAKKEHLDRKGLSEFLSLLQE